MKRAPDSKTTVLIADPAWPHANGSKTNSGKSPKYDLMNLREIEALGPAVVDLAGPNAVLYLWVTGPHLRAGFSVLSAWGFEYRSFHVWRKRRIACGFWSRSNGEVLLVGERGRPRAPRPGLLMRAVFDADPDEARHSSKPSTVSEYVDAQWPSARKIELFARSRRTGWKTVGRELGTLMTTRGIVRAK